jgi:hypothetical protein
MIMQVKSEYVFRDGLMIRSDTQDVENLLKQNAEERASGENQQSGKNMRKVASIPVVIVEYLKTRPMAEGGPIDLNLIGCDPDHAVRFTRFLNDRENYMFRTSEARV